MPVHYLIEYSNGSAATVCLPHTTSPSLQLETSFPDLYNHDVNGFPHNVERITITFSKFRDVYPTDVTIACWASHPHIYVDEPAPVGSTSYGSSVDILNRSGPWCEIRVTCTNTDYEVDEWDFNASYCVDDTGSTVPCDVQVNYALLQPKRLKIKVKREPSYACPT